MKKHKVISSDEQKTLLSSIHREQIVLEFSLVALMLSIFTLNISSIVPGYGIVIAAVMTLSVIVLFIFGSLLSFGVFSMRYFGKPLAPKTRSLRIWLIVMWWHIPVAILLLILSALVQDPIFSIVSLGIVALLMLTMFSAIIVVLAKVHVLWKKYNSKKRSPARGVIYAMLALSVLSLTIFGSYVTMESIPFESTAVSDVNLELGQTEVRQVGIDGEARVTRNLIFGFASSTDKNNPVNEIVANGSRRYQYMYCSDGSYRYFTAEQFKDPNIGFTHQSPDSCALNGAGTQTTIADIPPAEKVIQQVPTYYPTYNRPSSYTTTCNSYSFTNSITCRTY